MCRQSDARVRRALRKYRVGSIIHLGIIGYVAVALPYWVKVWDFLHQQQAYIPYTEHGLPTHVVKELSWPTVMGDMNE